MKSVCEQMSAEMFPAVRALIAKELVEALGFSQVEVAQKMSITQPAVSQYQNELRGTKAKILKGNLRVFSLIQEAARVLAKSKRKDNSQLSGELLCNICKEIRGQGLL